MNLDYESSFWAQDKLVCFFDEAGYGSAAGSLWVAGVILKPILTIPDELSKVKDSKKTTHDLRDQLNPLIPKYCLWHHVMEITVDQINTNSPFHLKYDLIDDLVQSLPYKNVVTVYDGNRALRNNKYENLFYIKGDEKVFSGACASILAKTAKDKEMAVLNTTYPKYGFGHNSGYLRPDHIEALRKHGQCPVHRKSYIKNFVE